jgi:hypothetical protein
MIDAGEELAARPAPVSRRVLAAIAFLGHVPGLVLIARCRFTRALVRVNVVAAGLTLVAMAIAWSVAAEGERGWATLIAWLVGHFAWSTIFAGWILLGGAVRASSPPTDVTTAG